MLLVVWLLLTLVLPSVGPCPLVRVSSFVLFACFVPCVRTCLRAVLLFVCLFVCFLPATIPWGEVQVDFPNSHVAETAPFLAPPLDLDKNKHGSRRISTPLITMGLFGSPRAAPFDVLM